jgi:glutamate dehydrogenase
MPLKAEKLKSELIDRVLEEASSRLERARAAVIERFIRQFYANVPPDDLVGHSPDDLFGAAVSLWTFGARRQRGSAKVRVYNPRLDEHGWHSPHTVVEIVNDDMPFLVDSVTAALNRRELTVYLVIHPIVRTERDESGQLLGLAGDADAAAGPGRVVASESFMQVWISEQTSADRLAEIRQGLEDVLADVRAAVEDWSAMRGRVAETLETLATTPPPLPEQEIEEATAFLRWLDADHFTFLGYREYDFLGEGEGATLAIREGSGLGILRDDRISIFDGLRNFDKLPPEVRHFVRQSRLLMVTKSNRRATVHRPVHMDIIGVKKFDESGRIAGERLFVGLLTSTAYSRSPRDIPLLRRKVANVVERAGFAPSSHDGKALLHILETYPRDELFQISEDELLEIALGILHLQERQRIALFTRRDPFERFVSCLVYLPRDRYNTDLRLRIQDILARAYNGRMVDFFTHMGDDAQVRLHLIVKTTPGAIPDVDPADIERQLVEAGRSWADHLRDALIEAKGEERGLMALRRYGEAFPVSYQEEFSAHQAVFDIDRLEEAQATGAMTMNLYRPVEAPANELRLKLYNAGELIPLSDMLPMLENMGLKIVTELPYAVHPGGQERPFWIHDFIMTAPGGAEIDVGAVKDKFHEAYARVWSGEMEDDGFNRLVLCAGFDWRDVTVIRAYSRFLRQAGIPFSLAYMEETMANNAEIAKLLVQLFKILHDPADRKDVEQRAAAVTAEIEKGLDAVSSLDEDRILRRFLNLIRSTLRTNFFQKTADGQPKPYLALKLDSQAIDELPLPRPMVEIFVYSPRVEAVHLRGGKVARGGIRWSDRREDFRTEVLGLMKAQLVKNAVIVPVGSKGGFVVKRPPTVAGSPGGREALMAEVVTCYQTMMRGLLDLTDNLVGGQVVPPADLVRHDDDDPYLVVAADKGTAGFSDIANGIAEEYGFWLGDAFASGGSAGYDHKKMGITARGAWESVKRHFRELGTDIQTQDFTVVGVGDMSGDVFGNGMLLSRHIRLVGAFNHLHIFVDPDPDPEASWQERKRLFDLPRSAWTDYDAKLISPGGGVFDRKAKAIPLTPEMRRCFGIETDRASLTPAELIRAMLRAPVDLLWMGGIGTYVKASTESHAEVGDRANDPLRVDGAELRCKVVGEGANLGFTQRGRIEYALRGGRINTDAIDNSGGVDCSDHEVNIKIALNEVMSAGDMTRKQRDRLLEAMTEEVASLVLRNNYLQGQAISVIKAQDWLLLDQQGRFMRALERAGKLNRALEFLPNDEDLAERLSARQGLTRPELAVLLAYAKIALYEELLPSDLPDDPQLVDDLMQYFPKPLRENFAEAITGHRLRREIIATAVTNSLVNRVGPTFVHAMKEKTGMPASDIARAYAITRGVFGLRRLWSEIQALDTRAPASAQIAMLVEINRVAERGTLWFLRTGMQPLDIAANIEACGAGIAELAGCLGEVATETERETIAQRMAEYAGDGVPEDLARRVASLHLLAPGLDIVRIAQEAKTSVPDVARTYFVVGDRFGFDWLRDAAASVGASDNHWQRMAVAAIVEDLYGHQKDLTLRVIESGNGAPAGNGAIDAWVDQRGAAVHRMEALFADIRQAGVIDLPMLAVANRQLRSLVSG